MELPPIWSTQHGNRWKLLKNHSIDRACGSYWALLIKSQPRPSNMISLIRWQKQWHLNSDPALGRKKKKKSCPNQLDSKSLKLFCFQWLEMGPEKKRNKCKSSHCLKKRKRQPHTPLRTRTYTLPVHCVDSDKQEKAGPPDSAMMKLYFRISLFVLVGRVQVKCSS